MVKRKFKRERGIRFKIYTKEETHNMIVEASRLLDVCEGCPFNTLEYYDDTSACQGCKTFKKISAVGEKLIGYNLTKRQKQLLNKGHKMSAEDIEELFHTGVEKKIIANAIGFSKANNNHFNLFLEDVGAELTGTNKGSIPEETEGYLYGSVLG